METYTVNQRPVFLRDKSIQKHVSRENNHYKAVKKRKPQTRYTKSGDINIAYQVFGSGSTDLVYIPGWVSNIEWMWNCPELVDFLEELGKVARVILFDKRGTGLSDRVVEFSTLEERMEDIQAVMNAVDSEKAILFGHSEGGSVSTLYAATHPDRVISLITFGAFAKRRYSKDYPWAPTDEEREEVYDMIEKRWGKENMGLETLAPSKSHDHEFMDWLASYCRFGASPNAALILTKINTEVNVIDILSSVRVPTLILQRKDDIDVRIEEGRFMSQRIEKSRFVEFQGNDHLFWVGNTAEVLNEMKLFIEETKNIAAPETKLATVLNVKLSCVPKNVNILQELNIISGNFDGKVVPISQDEFKIIFNGSVKAIKCSEKLQEILREIGIGFSACIYMKDIPTKGYKESLMRLDETARKILSVSLPNQILITQTITNSLSGVTLNLTKFNGIYDHSNLNVLNLYQINFGDFVPRKLNKNTKMASTTLIETVLQIINKHMTNEEFGLEMLCKESGVSERQLQRKIKELTDKSPNQLINLIRLNKAKELLEQQNFTVAEVAFRTGFSSPSYFSKCFKKEFGKCPTDVL